MAAVLTIGTIGRGIQFSNLSGILVTVATSGATYATATGGMPIDLVGILQQATPAGNVAPNYIQALNPADVVGILPIGLSTNGFVPGNLVMGTAVDTTPPGMSSGNATASPGILTSAPATFRLWGTGNGNALHLAEVADGAVTDTVTFLLLVNRNGANS